MGITCAWSSCRLDVITAWSEYRRKALEINEANGRLNDSLNQRHIDWLNERDATLAVVVRQNDRIPVGIRLHGTDEAPEGWRRDEDYGCLVPDLRRRTGKSLAAELDTVRHLPHPAFDMPGLPGSSVFGWFHGGLSYSPAAFMLDDEVWAGWGVPTEHIDRLADVIDGDLWERRPLSEYHAASEAIEQLDARSQPAA